MVAKPALYQVSTNAGEIGEALWGHTGLKSYYAALSLAERVEPVPQGGLDLLPGSRQRALVRRPLTVTETVAGGVSAGLAAAGVIATFALAANRTLAALDLKGFYADVKQEARILKVEAQRVSDGLWVDIGGVLPIGTAAADRRLAFAPRQPVVCSHVRLVLDDDPSATIAFTFASFDVLEEAASGTPVARVLRFTRDQTTAYVAVASAGHVDYFDAVNFSWSGASPLPWSDAEIAAAQWLQREETGILFQQDKKPLKLLRHGAGHDWSSEDIIFENMAQADLGGDYVKVSEQWEINVSVDGTLNFDEYGIVVRVDGQETSRVDLDQTDWTATAAALKAAIEELPNVGVGISLTHEGVTGGGPYVSSFAIDLTGDLNIGGRFDLEADVVTNPGSGTATASRQRRGDPGGEDVISAARGWPRCGRFIQQRLAMGGLAARPSSYLLSRTGEFFQYDLDLVAANGPVLDALDTDGGETILQIAHGRHMVIFTDQGEYYVADRAIDATQPRNIVKSSAVGISATVPVVEQEGALIFVNSEGTMVYAGEYDDVRQAYVPEPLSLLSTHLMQGLSRAALQKSSTQTDADRLWLLRDDGLLLCGALIRNQDVTGFVRWPTDGAVRDVVIGGHNTPWLLVERSISGETDLVLETLEDGLLFDQAISQSHDPASAVIPGLDDLEGAAVWADVDGYIEGPFTVSGGSISVDGASAQSTIGRWTPPRARAMPPPRNVSDRVVLNRPARVHTVEVDVIETQSVAVRANEGRVQDVLGSGLRAGDPVDSPLPRRSELVRVTGLTGYSRNAFVEITQARPGALKVRNWAYSVSM